MIQFLIGLLLVGLCNLESINLSFTVVTDGGLRKLSGLSSIKSLNLDTRQITDAGLAALTSKTVQKDCQGKFCLKFVTSASFNSLNRAFYLSNFIDYEVICSCFWSAS